MQFRAKKNLPGIFIGLALCASVPALADECGPLQRMTSLDLTQVPGGARMLVPVKVNGVTKQLLLGTAGGSTTLTAAAAGSLNLNILRGDKGRLLDTKGNASDSYFSVKSFALGDLSAKNAQLMVTPAPNIGVNTSVDGILSVDLMNRFDVEMDFASRKLNLFLADHCAGHVVYWPADTVAVIPITLHSRAATQSRSGPVVAHVLQGSGAAKDTSASSAQGGFQPSGLVTGTAYQMSGSHIMGYDIRMPVTLDGKELIADIDTGAENSTLNSAIAKAVFSVTADSPGSSPLKPAGAGADQKGVETVTVTGMFDHAFHTLSFGDVTVVNPHFTVRPDLTGARDAENSYVTGSHVERVDDSQAPDITIGMDVLKQLHLYFAFNESRLYVTPAAPAQAAHLASPLQFFPPS